MPRYLTSLRAGIGAASACLLVLAAPLPASHAAPIHARPGLPLTVAQAATRPGPASLPPTFERNEGQAAPAVRFLLHGAGYTLFLTTHALTVLRQGQSVPQTVQLDLSHTGLPLQIQPAQPLPGVVNYPAGTRSPRLAHSYPNL